jgi:hypothetical protein
MQGLRPASVRCRKPTECRASSSCGVARCQYKEGFFKMDVVLSFTRWDRLLRSALVGGRLMQEHPLCFTTPRINIHTSRIRTVSGPLSNVASFNRPTIFSLSQGLYPLKLSAACGDGLSISSSTSCGVTSANLEGGTVEIGVHLSFGPACPAFETTRQ